jgi:hypothetical protein
MTEFLRRIMELFFRERSDRRRLRRSSSPPSIEFLEARQLLSGHTIAVTTLSDTETSGQTTLRDAINQADGDAGNTDAITFNSNLFANNTPGTITLSQGALAVTNSMIITGPGANLLTIAGNNNSQIFIVDDGNSAVTEHVTITGLTLTTGNADGGTTDTMNGGAVYNAEALTLTSDIVTGNQSTAGNGGAVENARTLIVSNDTFSANSANAAGGGGVFNSGSMISSNSTFSANAAGSGGGGIYNAGSLTSTNDTIANNSAMLGGSVGGGIYNFKGVLTSVDDTIAGNSAVNGGGISNRLGVWNSLNTIVAGNFTAVGSTTRSDVVNAGSINASNTLIGDSNSAGGITGGSQGNIVGVAAKSLFQTDVNGNPLLASNGGVTQTISVLGGSPAIGAGSALTNLATAVATSNLTTLTVTSTLFIAVGDALQIDNEILIVTGVNSGNGQVSVLRGQMGTTATTHTSNAAITLATDQTGQIRTGNDLGARNSQHVLTVNTTADDTLQATVAHMTLRAAIAIANSDGGIDAISFAPSLYANNTPGTITLTQGALTLKSSMTISGPGANLLTITANNNSQILIVDDGNSAVTDQVTISGLTLSGGTASGNTTDTKGGGAIFNAESLILSNDAFSSDTSSVSSGGAVDNAGTLVSNDNTYTGNTAFLNGGGIENSGFLTSTNDTFSGNKAKNGGAIDNNQASLTTVNDTVAGNFGSGGVANDGLSSAMSTWNSLNTIVVGNLVSTNSSTSSDVINNNGTINASNTLVGDANSSGTITNGSQHNVVGATTINTFQTDSNGNLVLANNGGTTPTIALTAGSKAINAGGTLATLAAAVTNAGTTTLTVGSSTFIAIGDSLKIDNEIMIVTAVNSGTVGVLRGQMGTTATTHANGVTITLATDQRSVVRGLNDLGAFEAVTPTVNVTATNVIYSGSAYSSASLTVSVFANGTTIASPPLTYTYYLASDTTFQNPLSLAPTQAGSYVVVVNYVPNSSAFYQYSSSQGMASFTIQQVKPTVTINSTGGVYNGNAHTASATVSGLSGSPGASLDGVAVTVTYYLNGQASTTPPTQAGFYEAVAVFKGSTNYSYNYATTTFTIAKVTPTISISEADGTYNGSPFVATVSLTGVGGSPTPSLDGVSPTIIYYLNGQSSTTAPSQAGSYEAAAVFGGSTNYAATFAQCAFSIAKAQPTIAISATGGAYNGNPFVATSTLTGTSGSPTSNLDGVALTVTYYLGGVASATAPTQVGFYEAVAVFNGSANYTSGYATTTFTIAKATPTISIANAGGTFNGGPYSATATLTGANGSPTSSLDGVAPTIIYYQNGQSSTTPPSQAGSYEAAAVFDGSANYVATYAQCSFTIAQAAPTIAISDAGGTYNGKPFAAKVAMTDVNGLTVSSLEGVSLTVTYYLNGQASTTPPTQTGFYYAVAEFIGSANYAYTYATTTFTITPATPKISVSDAGGTYNGNPFVATATLTGVGGSPTPSLDGVSATVFYYVNGQATPTPPTQAGSYYAVAVFGGSSNYLATYAQTTFTIAKAKPTVSISATGGTYNGNPYTATATLTGVGGSPTSSLDGVSATVTYYVNGKATATPPTQAGFYYAVAVFNGSANYAAVYAQTTFTIAKAKPTVSVSAAGGTYNGNSFFATATLADIGGTSVSSLDGVSPTVTYYVNGKSTTTPPTQAGFYYAAAVFGGSANYAAAYAQTKFTIAKATPTITISDAGGTYTGKLYAATFTLTGVSGSPTSSLDGVSPTVIYYVNGKSTSTPPTQAGFYYAAAVFSGSANYAATYAQTTFTIAKATPTITISDAGGTYNGKPFAATTTMTDVNGSTVKSLDGVSMTVTYYLNGQASTTPPTQAGSYDVVAVFNGSANYTDNYVSTTFTIAKATPTVSISDAGGVHGNHAFAATASIAGANGQQVTSLDGVSLELIYYLGGVASSTAPTQPGFYYAAAVFAGSPNYNATYAQTTFTIT